MQALKPFAAANSRTQHVGGATGTLLMTAAFLTVILAVNFRIFTHPIVESGDFAANSLLVQQAKHFRLLTGNYSRWHFVHPGPAFLCLFALGEFVFHDVLHIVPAPFNGQLLIAIMFNVGLLYAALRICRKHVKLPAAWALLATAIVTVMVNANGPPAMLISNWMPDVLIFPLVLFAVSAASVLADHTSDLPFLAFSGMLLIHGHMVQFLFVGVLGGGTVAFILVRALLRQQLKKLLITRRRDLIISAAIVFVFALPPLLELILDRPNNLDAVLTYLHQTSGVRNNLGAAIGYFACFVFFIGAPEVALTKGPLGILSMGLGDSAVLLYCLVALLLVLVAMSLRIDRHKTSSPFSTYLLWITAASVPLFLYWATQITGGFLAFNGRFVYALHVLMWFVLLADAASLLDGRLLRILSSAALVCLAALVIAERGVLVSPSGQDFPEALRAASAAPIGPFGSAALTFDPADWPRAIAVANSMERLRKPFCVAPRWGFMFSRASVCPDMLVANKLLVLQANDSCKSPCRYIYRGETISLAHTPAALSLPVRLDAQDLPDFRATGFYDNEGSFCWTKKHAAITFLLSPEADARCFNLSIDGHTLPDRPAQVSMNGRNLGILSRSTPDRATFVVRKEIVRSRAENHIELETDSAGPVGTDPREIGFAFSSLTLRAAAPEQSCTVDTAQPEYISVSVEWGSGCYNPEGTPPNEWRWCGPDASLVIHNSSSKPRGATLAAEFSTDHDEPAALHIRSALFDEKLTVNRRPLPFSRALRIPPGDHSIMFECLAARSTAPDPRNLVLRIDHFRLEPMR